MKYTPHIIAAVAVAVVATAALATTTTNNDVTFELYQDNSKVSLSSESTFDNYQKVTITASEPVYWKHEYWDTDLNHSTPNNGEETSNAIRGMSGNIGTHHIDYRLSSDDSWTRVTKIHIEAKDVTSISFTAEDKRTPGDIRSYGVSFGDTINIGASTYTFKLKATDYEVHWKEEIYKNDNLTKTNTSYGHTHQVSNGEGGSKNIVSVSTDNKNWTVLATINIEKEQSDDTPSGDSPFKPPPPRLPRP